MTDWTFVVRLPSSSSPSYEAENMLDFVNWIEYNINNPVKIVNSRTIEFDSLSDATKFIEKYFPKSKVEMKLS